MTIKTAWDTAEIKVLYDNDATYSAMAEAASKSAHCKVTSSTVEKFAKRHWPTRAFDVAAKQLREQQRANNASLKHHKKIRAGKTTLPTLSSLEA